MIHTQVYGFFQTCLPDQAKKVKEYFPNGKNSIRIRKTNGQEFIFSLREPKAWKFETIDQFLADMKGEKRNMDEMIRYIFGSLRCSETAMRVFAKTLRKQRSFNCSTVMVATVMTVNMLIQDLEIRSMRDEIGNLKNEIKELRKTEGD